MPYGTARGVNRGVQNEEELQKIRQQKKKKQQEKTKKWCQMIGLTVAEFILCLICLGLGCYYYHIIEVYRISFHVGNSSNSVRSILEPPAPLAIASVYATLTYVDLIAWHTMRPTTYFCWIMVSSSGFLMFLLYAGCILLTCKSLIAYIAIVFACITALVFLADLICMLLSLKRFPAPYWVIRRKYDRIDQCLCTGDRNPIEEEVERPIICRCGNHWGEPCTCDEMSCGCHIDKTEKTLCDCCECAAQALVIENANEDIMTTSCYCNDMEEDKKTFTQVNTLEVDDYIFDVQPSSGRYCIDGLPQNSLVDRSTYASQMPLDKVQKESSMFCTNKSTAVLPPQAAFSRKFDDSQRASGMMSSGRTSSNRIQFVTCPNKIATTSIDTGSKFGRNPSLTNRPSGVKSIPRGLTNPAFKETAKIGVHSTLTEPLEPPSVQMPSCRANNRSHNQKLLASRKNTDMTYSVYTTTVDNENVIRRRSIEAKYDGKKIRNEVLNKSSNVEELGEDDYRQNLRTYKLSHSANKFDLELGYISDPEIFPDPKKIEKLPGQIFCYDDAIARKKNVSISAKSYKKSSNTIENSRPRTTVEGLGEPRLIRNVSTTVRAVRPLSKMIETENEEFKDEPFSSERTICLNKVHELGSRLTFLLTLLLFVIERRGLNRMYCIYFFYFIVCFLSCQIV
ncbi:hypothetical protein ABEB36_009750 [Hypothenemus hampei]|uniref:Uncharacterized protein n=1 Tax=Hypothenemus hampei TaxID=57062 RepID=A0ABD1EHC5_HYPHA